MYILSDDAMEHLLKGNYVDVIKTKKLDSDISIHKLYMEQDIYKSYQGFRKFFVAILQPIFEKICFIDDSKLLAKIIDKVVKLK